LPCAVGGYDDRGGAADGQGQAASVAERQLLSALNSAKSAGKLRVKLMAVVLTLSMSRYNTNGLATHPEPLVPSSPVPYRTRCCGRFPLEAQPGRPLWTDQFSGFERLTGEQDFDWPHGQAGVDAARGCGGGRGRGVLRVNACTFCLDKSG
jgi:hypothetical protein